MTFGLDIIHSPLAYTGVEIELLIVRTLLEKEKFNTHQGCSKTPGKVKNYKKNSFRKKIAFLRGGESSEIATE